MTQQSKKILDDFQVRKSWKEKETFRSWLCGELEKAGYAPKVEAKWLFAFNRNVVVGDPERAEVLLTAHYDTQAVLPIPNFITPQNFGWYLLYQLVLVGIMFLGAGLVGYVVNLLTQDQMWAYLATMAGLLFCLWWMLYGKANKHTVNDNTSGVLTLVETALALPEELRDKVCFVFFDNEEKGLFGSAAFAGTHKEVKKSALVLNCDCVSDGDAIRFFPTKALMKDKGALERIEAAFQGKGDKTVEVVRGFGFYPSDNANFKRACGVCALKHSKLFGLYMDRIHTNRDTVLEEENIRLLRDGVIRFVSGKND